jgi:hypothetical protein
VRRVVLSRRGLERAEVRAIDLVALHQAHVAEKGGVPDGVQDGAEHRNVRRHEFRPARPVLIGGVEDVRDLRELRRDVARGSGIEQVGGDVPDSRALRSAAPGQADHVPPAVGCQVLD